MLRKSYFLFSIFLFSLISVAQDVDYTQKIADSKIVTDYQASKEFVDALKNGSGAQLVQNIKANCDPIMQDKTNQGKTAFNNCIRTALTQDANISTTDLLKAAENFGFIKETADPTGKKGYITQGGEPLESTKLYYHVVDKLTEALKVGLYGPNWEQAFKEGKQKIIDHSTFVKVYRHQLSKNLLIETSKFCLENFSANKISTGAKMDKANYQTVLGNLGDASGTESNAYKQCVVYLKGFCYCNLNAAEAQKLGKRCEGTATTGKFNMNQGTLMGLFGINPNGSGTYTQTQTDMLDKIQSKACPLIKRLEQYKLFVTSLMEQEKAMDAKDQGLNSRSNEVLVETAANIKNIEKITTLTSKKIRDLTQDIVKEDAKLMEECASTADEARCAQILQIADGKSLKDLLLEEQTKKELVKEMIEKSQDAAELKKVFLTFENMNEAEIDKMLTNGVDIDAIKAEYKAKYDQEIVAIQNRIKDKMDALEVKKDDFSNNTAQNKLGNIKTEVEEQGERLERVIQYNNLVSSFLELGKDKKKFGQLAKEELDSNTLEQDPTYSQYFDNIQDVIGQNVANANTDDGDYQTDQIIDVIMDSCADQEKCNEQAQNATP